MKQGTDTKTHDLFIIGGGVNGCGIARDAAGRGLDVALAEMGDLASATSSASTKLFHGGLRYLEYFEFGLVKKALIEREILLKMMPHISRPMRFILPLNRDMRFDGATPTSRLLGVVMPWLKGRRPSWLIRLGLVFYDHMGGRKILPATRSLNLKADPAGGPLKPHFKRAYEYSDCVVDDARLVALNARDAHIRGAKIMVGSKVVRADHRGDFWEIETHNARTGHSERHRARALVNATGPWVEQVIRTALNTRSPAEIRLVRGSHIIVPKMFDHGRAYYLQGQDGRLVFVIPYHDDFTLIGTTEAPHPDPDNRAEISDDERAYLLSFVNARFQSQISVDDIVQTYSGVRPLFDQGAGSATSATRDYQLVLEGGDQAPVLHVFGGKITTYRVLAEAAMRKLAPLFPAMTGAWTAQAHLPGGDFPVDGGPRLAADLQRAHPYLSAANIARLVRNYGTDAQRMLEGAHDIADLGTHFGAELFEREVRWMIEHEFARTASDVVWRRSKLGLKLSPSAIATLESWMRNAA